MTVTMNSNVAHLMSLETVRERAQIVYNAAKDGRLNNFDFHEEKLNDTAEYVTDIIKVCRCQVYQSGTQSDSKNSAILDLQVMIPSHHTVDGSILKLEITHV